jgi:hypothetical protein
MKAFMSRTVLISATAVVFMAQLVSPVAAFAVGAQMSSPTAIQTEHRDQSRRIRPFPRPVVMFADGTGGWGIGNSRAMVPEEFANKRGGERGIFEGYELQDRNEFMKKIQNEVDVDRKKQRDLEELLGVAKMAGISVKDPSERLNKFDSSILASDDDIDLSV